MPSMVALALSSEYQILQGYRDSSSDHVITEMRHYLPIVTDIRLEPQLADPMMRPDSTFESLDKTSLTTNFVVYYLAVAI